MFNYPDRRYFSGLSSEAGFNVDVTEKAYRLSHILSILTKDAGLKFILKGGTAINFIYFDLPRLSLDIDLNYVGSPVRETMLSDRGRIDGILVKLFSSLGYGIRHTKRYSLQQYILEYANSVGNNDRIKVEINFSERVPILTPVKKKFNHFFDFPEFRITTYQMEEIFATKIRALLFRTTPRDLFDVYELSKYDSVDENILRKLAILYSCLNGDFREIDIKVIDSVTERDMKRFLLPLLRKGTDINLNEIKETVKKFVSALIKPDKSEQEFLEHFYKKEFMPELLFGNIRYNPEIKEHPVVKWKLQGNKS